jgi:hypothetical protein
MSKQTDLINITDVITASGSNVGIGDSNPLSIFHVGTGASANVPITFAPATGGNIEFRNTSSTGSFTITNGNGSSEKIRIDSSGKVGIGRTDPSQLLEVHKNAGGDQTAAKFSAHNYGDTGKTYIELGTEYGDGSSRIGSFNTSGNKSALVFEVHASASGSFSEAMSIDDVGRVTTPYQPHACWRSQNSTNGSYRFPKSHQHLNIGNHLSSTGRYTCPVDGTYHFSASGFTNYNNSYGYLHLKLNGNSVHDVHWNHGPMGIGHTAISGQVTLDLSSGDYLETWQNTGSGAWIQDCISSVIFLG